MKLKLWFFELISTSSVFFAGSILKSSYLYDLNLMFIHSRLILPMLTRSPIIFEVVFSGQVLNVLPSHLRRPKDCKIQNLPPNPVFLKVAFLRLQIDTGAKWYDCTYSWFLWKKFHSHVSVRKLLCKDLKRENMYRIQFIVSHLKMITWKAW